VKRFLLPLVLLLVGLGAGVGARLVVAGGADAAPSAEATDSTAPDAAGSDAAVPTELPSASPQALAEAADSAEATEVERLAAAMGETLEETSDSPGPVADTSSREGLETGAAASATVDASSGDASPAGTPLRSADAGAADGGAADEPVPDGGGEGRSFSPGSGGDGGSGTEGSGPAPGESSPGSAYSDTGSQRLAKIFGAMDPRDAAEVLQGLTDDEVSAILVQMSERKVAAILSDFAPDRAASLSRVVLLARNGGET
jgi:hypothetical protein